MTNLNISFEGRVKLIYFYKKETILPLKTPFYKHIIKYSKLF